MKFSMVDVNKKANTIINQVAESGEVATIYKRGKPIAEIHPIRTDGARQDALAYLANVILVNVDRQVGDVIETGRKRGV